MSIEQISPINPEEENDITQEKPGMTRRDFLRHAGTFSVATTVAPEILLGGEKNLSGIKSTESGDEIFPNKEVVLAPEYIEGVEALRDRTLKEGIEFAGTYREYGGVGEWSTSLKMKESSGVIALDNDLLDFLGEQPEHVRMVHGHPPQAVWLSPPSFLDMTGAIQSYMFLKKEGISSKFQAVDRTGIWTLEPILTHRFVVGLKYLLNELEELPKKLVSNESYQKLLREHGVTENTDTRVISKIISDNESSLDLRARTMLKHAQKLEKTLKLDEIVMSTGNQNFDQATIDIVQGSYAEEGIPDKIKELGALYAKLGFKLSYEPLPMKTNSDDRAGGKK